MSFHSILVANRGEIAIRISRAAASLGRRAVTVYPADDAASLHTRSGDDSHQLPGTGARAYLDGDAIIAAARATGCDAVHPGYGFLAEQAEFARQCEAAGLTFIGPSVANLELFGDKARARTAARVASVPILRGIDHPVTLDETREFLQSLGHGSGVMIKAVAGGGGRGTRAVTSEEVLEAAFRRCQSEAKAAFGLGDVYVEEFIPRARHIEVQVLGDMQGNVVHLGERECSLQRRNQKVIEIAPAPALDRELRDEIIAAAMRFASAIGYRNLGTFEFLLDVSGRDGAPPFVFIEANARLQVEHTVTEQVTGFDLVQAQIQLAEGDSLTDLGLAASSPVAPRGYAIQARVNMETIGADGRVVPSAGVLTAYDAPGGPGIRTDGFGYAGYEVSTSYDSLLAKVIGWSPSPRLADAARRASRALSEFRIEGVRTNIPLLQNILDHPDFAAGQTYIQWIDDHITELVELDERTNHFIAAATPERRSFDEGFAGARIDTRDPLALFTHDANLKAEKAATARENPPGEDGMVALCAPIQGTIISIDVETGQPVLKGQQVAVVEAMKMEHVILADQSGVVHRITMSAGDVVRQGFPLVYLAVAEVDGSVGTQLTETDPDHIRPDLEELFRRRSFTLDESRPEAVAKRHARGYRMPRENIARLADPDSFREYWPLIVARQHQRFDMETLRRETPADGLVAGTCSINGDLFDDSRSRAIIIHYDYTVLAGTQGGRNHYKQDRMFELANRFRIPVVLFGEGGGGRPGDDRTGPGVAFDNRTFTQFSRLSGLVPLVAIVNGRTFAGNTALVAACDVIIATESTTIAMGGPAMIEGGGLGVYTPEEVGPLSFQVPNGVVDIVVRDEDEAVDVTKKYLSYFQGPIASWSAPDQRRLRHIVPENRLRLYDMREVINTVADEGSVLEIRPKFGIGVITAFIRIEGKPLGLIANNPFHLAGAIDSDGADKGARFMQLCDAFDIPIVSLMDCPGIMVGPDAERTALVRHSLRMFNAGANLSVPLFGVVVRKAYGLGVLAMCGASSTVGFFTVAWPTAEFAGMNIEGSVKLGYRKELAAIEDPEERRTEFDKRVQRAYESSKAVNAAVGGGLDDVIDPAETRSWIVESLKRLPPPAPRTGKKYPYIDPW